MSKSRTKKKRKSKQTQKREHPRSIESRAAEAMTVFWMVSFLATFAAELAFAVTFAINRKQPSESGAALANAMFLVALLCGVSTLLATPITLNLRSVEPPRRIVLFAIIVATIPLVSVAMSFIQS